jgi:ABC-type uncharacterized transport system YnjBCD ATPase subunit
VRLLFLCSDRDMNNLIDLSPDALQNDLANGLRSNLGLLRELAAKPKHVPGDEFYQRIAERLIEQMKRAGVEKVTRRVSRAAAVPAQHPAGTQK